MKKNKLKIYIITILSCILLVQVFYALQVNFVYKDAQYLSPTIIIPLIVGTILGTVIGKIYNQRVKIQEQANIIGDLRVTDIINNILLLSNYTSEPTEFLRSIIDTIIEVDFIKLDSQIGFFLKDTDGKYRIKVHHNLKSELLTVCGKKGIEAGECICGKAILSQKIEFTNCVNHRHSINYNSMKDHVQYTIPITYAKEVLGVMILYLEAGHEKNERELKFLNSIGSIIALVLHKYFTEKEKKVEIVKLNNELTVQNKSLIKKNQELDRFVYSTSHDLRSPILSIMGLLGLFKEDLMKEEEKMQTIQLMEDALEKTDEMITNILDYSRNENLEVNYETTNIKELINEVLDIHKYVDGKEIKCDVEISVETIQTDKSRFKTILNNLISNAIKYRKEDFPLKIDISFMELDSDEYRLTIKDNGEGIEKKELTKIFNMFHRSSSTSKGAGLGLYICKQIVDNFDGKIEVDSQLGSWTTFTIYIPVKL